MHKSYVEYELISYTLKEAYQGISISVSKVPVDQGIRLSLKDNAYKFSPVILIIWYPSH